jgi:hypothetical protein
MAAPLHIDSNRTESRWSEETALKTPNPSAVWQLLEVNNYLDARGQFTKVVRAPISADRQRKKGITTDLDAKFGHNTDLTQFNMQDLLQGLFFADLRRQPEFTATITSVATVDDSFNAAAGLNIFAVNDLVFARGLDTSLGNNGLHRVTAIAAGKLTSDHNLADETPPAGAKLIKVGVQTAPGDIDVDASQPFPALTSTTLNFTTLSLTPGMYIWIGGDLAIERFSVNAVNNNCARILSIAANRLVLDKCSKGAMITEANAAQTIRLFFGRVLKNESSPTLIKRRTYQIERQLGASDEAIPAQTQSEYFTGCVFDSAKLDFRQADKITMDCMFMALDQELRSGVTGLKAGTRPNIENADAQVTSINLKRVRISKIISGDEAPAALYSHIDNMTLNISNNSTVEKALTVLGGYDYSHGDFTAGGQFTGTFFSIDGVAAIRNNDDVTADLMSFGENSGWVIDMPLIGLGDGSIDVQKDKAIKSPITFECASGEEIHPNLDYTVAWTWFDYLPTLASTPNG